MARTCIAVTALWAGVKHRTGALRAQHRTATVPRSRIGVDYVLIARNQLESRIEKPPKTSMFSGASLVAGARNPRDRHSIAIPV